MNFVITFYRGLINNNNQRESQFLTIDYNDISIVKFPSLKWSPKV